MSELRVFGIAGKMGTGKDYAALVLRAMLAERGETRVRIVAFADMLKIFLMARGLATYEELFANEKSYQTRVLLQRGGDDLRRDLGANVFAEFVAAQARVEHARGNCTVLVVCDVRYENELLALRRLSSSAQVVVLDAPLRNARRLEREAPGNAERQRAIAAHSSETSIDGGLFGELPRVPNDSDGDEALRSVFARMLDTVAQQ